ncbi:S8 family serine peptidase [Actinoplanes sp. NPDC049265]|uniref:S8 family serine peptidase n=1 Tax=Actinoplanes sp. NPDC049265 TaxID=3363902 RepID=UPI00371867E1
MSVLAAVAPAPAWAAARVDGDPPALPKVSSGCVGPSNVVAGGPSWAFRRVGPADVWPLTKGAGMTVAVLDSGISPGGGGLAGAVETGMDVVGGGRGDVDCYGRGTALAALIAARPAENTLFVGVAPESRVLPVKIVDGKGRIPPSAMAKGVTAATNADVDVILIGVGSPAPDAALRQAVHRAVARDIVVVAAVSDEKPKDNRPVPPWYPASDPDVLAVGGIAESGVPTETTTRESGLDLLAPGDRAFSVGPSGTGNYLVGGPAVAAAHVAAAAALVRAYHPELGQAEVRRRLAGTAAGAGALDVYAAVADEATPVRDVAARAAPRIVVPRGAPIPPQKTIAAAVAAGTVLAAAAAALTVSTVRRGRRRRWRP